MSFTPRQLKLLAQSCYGDPLLPEHLERIVVEGPGPYDWPPAPGYYEGEQIPLWERIFAQIWHQGTIYPATYVAVPIWCEVIARFPAMKHAQLVSLLSLIEQSRMHYQPPMLSAGQIVPADVEHYESALRGLLPHLTDQLKLLSDGTVEGFRAVESVLALIAYATGQRWVGSLIGGTPLTREEARYLTDQSLYHHSYTSDPLILPRVMQVAELEGRQDLPNDLRAAHELYLANLKQQVDEPDLEF